MFSQTNICRESEHTVIFDMRIILSNVKEHNIKHDLQLPMVATN